MKAAAFEYVRPVDVAGAVAACGEGQVLAGGQSLGPMMNLRLAMPGVLVDVGRLETLRGVEDRGTHVAIGAAVTHAAIEDGIAGLEDAGLLRFVAKDIAFRAVRNRGTIGGSVAHADPAADWVSALTAIDADLELCGPEGARRVAMHGFVLGAYTTALGPGELIEALLIPKVSAGAAWGYCKIARKAGAFADAIGAVLLDPDRGAARVVAGALSGAPVLLEGLAAQAAGGVAADLAEISAVLAAAVPGLDRVKARLHAVAVRRALLQALGQ